MKLIGALLVLLSFGVQASDYKWMHVTAVSNTDTGIGTYIGTIENSDIKAIAAGKEAPVFVEISNLTVIDRNGNIKKSSELPWSEGKYIVGNTFYLRVNNIIQMQSITKKFSQELSDYFEK